MASASRKSFFWPFGIGAHVPRRHQPRIVPQRVKLATEMMSTDAGVQADQARWHVGKPYLHSVARPLLTQHNCAAIVRANNVERVLTDIDADYGNRSLFCRRHGMLLVLAPLASLSLAAQEHGRTIPIAGVGDWPHAMLTAYGAQAPDALASLTGWGD